MPQDNQTPQQVPGSDVLLDTLRRSRISDDQRQQIWDAYHTQGDEKSFVGAMRNLPVNDDIRQNLYDMRYKGWKNEGNKPSQPQPNNAGTVTNLDTMTAPKGDVRPSTKDVQNQRVQKTNDEVAAFYGRMIPDAAIPVLGAANRYLVEPFEKMSQAGAKMAGFVGRGAVLGGAAGEQAQIPGQTPEQLYGSVQAQTKQYPKLAGAAEGAGELVGGTVADPRMWPFAIEGAAKGALSELAARGFSSQMLWQAATSVPEIKNAIKRGDSYEAARLITTSTGSAGLGLLGAKGEAKTKPEAAVRTVLDKTAGPTPVAPRAQQGSDEELNNRIKTASILEDRSTPMGPISQTGGQQLQLDFTTKAPNEAKSPSTTTGATRAGSPPVVDRQALVAPNPQDFLGKESPIPLTRLPKSVREGFAQGGTQGMPPIDISPRTPLGGLDIQRLKDGVKYATDSNGVRVTIPDEIPEGKVQEYAAQKIAEQIDMRAKLKASIGKPPEPVDVASELHDRFSKIADITRQADLAEDDGHVDRLNGQKADLEQRAMDMLRQQPLTKDHVKAFEDQATRFDAQAKAVRDLTEATIKNRGVKNELTDLRSQGGPGRSMVIDPDTGERGFVAPPDKVGRGGRSVLDELQGRVPTSDFDKIQVQGKPEGVSDQEWAEHVSKLQEERNGLKRKISDAVTIASETGASVADMGIEEHVDRLKQIEQLMGKYAEPSGPGRRPNKPVEVDENGAIKAPEVLKSWSLERARTAFGSKLKQMPTDEEFYQHADMLSEKGRLFRQAAQVAKDVVKRQGERGAIGEIGLKGKVQGEVKRVALGELVPKDEDIMKRAQAAKIYAREIDDKFPMGTVGFLSKDGKIGIDNGHMDHDSVAQTVLPEVRKSGSPLRAMLEKGWIRKASPTDYEAWNLDSKTRNTIEMDMMRSGHYGQEMNLDTKTPDNRFQSLKLDSGWEDFDKAINKAKAEWAKNPELGALKGGTKLAVSSTVGGIAGTVIGAHLGHPVEGMAIGWGLGFITPAIVDHPLFWNKLNAIKLGITSLGIKMADWLQGPTQEKSVLGSDMATIRDAQQRDLKGPTRSVVNRLAQLPGDVYTKMFDKFAFINDRPGAVQTFMMKFDPRGAAFRDLRGKIDIENSPYVSAWLAAGGGGGLQEAHLLDYKNVIRDAQNSKMGEHLNDYLNLKAYQRVYDVMQERIQEHDQNIQKMQAALQTPKLPVEVEAGIKKALRESKADRQDIIDKLISKTLVPQPYDPPRIASDLQAMQAQLGPKFNQVKMLADRVFALNRKVLDMTHDAGIVGDADYQKYTSRGDEYIPIHRIMEQVSDNTARISGKGSPLYLRQQNVIKALMGSDRVNRDPIIASADANREAIREVIRNGVIKDYLKLAHADPQGVGTYFKAVPSGYKAKIDEGLVGVYDGGTSHTFAAPSWLAESLKNVSPSSLDVIGKGPMQMFSQILRKGATVGNLAWSVPNALRHLGDMAIMSEAGLKDIKTLPKDAAGLVRDWTKSVYGSITHDQTWQEYMRSGAAYSTLQRMISPEMALDLKTMGFKQKIAHGRIIEGVQDFNAAVEDATKMTTFRRLREAGYTEKAAAWETRRYGGGPDFAKQGNLTPAINLASMFFNAHLQYVSRVFARAAENPARVAVALGALTGMGMTLNEWNTHQKDEKGNQLIRKVPYTDRENNFVVLTGDTYQSSSGATLPVYIKVPKPSFVKFLYNPIENMLNKVAGNEERTGTQLGLQALGNLSPGQMDLQQGQIGQSVARGVVSSLNPIIKTPLEEAMNYKTTGTGMPIVPGREQNIDPQFQYGPGTSETAKRIGEGGLRGAVAGGAEGASIGYLLGGWKGAGLGGGLGSVTGAYGISPRRAEHVIDSTTAGVGRIATGLVDPFLGAVKQTHMEGPEKLAQTPIGGPIAARFVSTSIDQQEQSLTQEFYQSAQAAQEPIRTLQFLQKNHPEQIPAYIAANKDNLWRGKIATDMQGRLGVIQNAQKQIEQNIQMSDKDKADALKNLHDVKMQVLNVFTKVMKPSPQLPR